MYSNVLEGKFSSNTTTFLLAEITKALTEDFPKVIGLQGQSAPPFPTGRVMVEKAGDLLMVRLSGKKQQKVEDKGKEV